MLLKRLGTPAVLLLVATALLLPGRFPPHDGAHVEGHQAAVQVTRGPYLNLGTPSSIVLRWRTSAPVVGRVAWGTAPGAVTWEMVEAAATTEHKLQLKGLLPSTTYYYAVGTPTDITAGGDASYRFTTSPPADYRVRTFRGSPRAYSAWSNTASATTPTS